MLDTLIQKLAKEMEIEGSLATEVPGVYSISVDEKDEKNGKVSEKKIKKKKRRIKTYGN